MSEASRSSSVKLGVGHHTFWHNFARFFLVHVHALFATTLTATSFLAQLREPQPHDISVPDKTWHSHLSNNGFPSSGSADIAMCPPVGDAAGDGFTSTGVPAGPSASLEVFIRGLAVRQTEQFTILTNRIADIQ